MFKTRVNMPCKQVVENAPMHDTARRLYEAALVLSKGSATKPGDVAAFFGVSQQRLKNWESRGISQQGMVTVCEQHPAIQLPWLSLGDGSPPKLGSGALAPTSTPAPPDHAQAVDIDTGLTPEALVGALADRLNAFEDLAQREVVAEKLRALAFYPDSAKARADVAQALSRTSMAAPAVAGTAERVLKAKLKTETKEFTRQGSTTHDRDND